MGWNCNKATGYFQVIGCCALLELSHTTLIKWAIGAYKALWFDKQLAATNSIKKATGYFHVDAFYNVHILNCKGKSACGWIPNASSSLWIVQRRCSKLFIHCLECCKFLINRKVIQSAWFYMFLFLTASVYKMTIVSPKLHCPLWSEVCAAKPPAKNATWAMALWYWLVRCFTCKLVTPCLLIHCVFFSEFGAVCLTWAVLPCVYKVTVQCPRSAWDLQNSRQGNSKSLITMFLCLFCLLDSKKNYSILGFLQA